MPSARLCSFARPSSCLVALLALAWGGGACGGSATSSAGNAGDGGAPVEAGSADASDGDLLPLAIPEGSFTAPPIAPIPFGAVERVPVSVGKELDYDATLFEVPATGRWVVVFDRILSDTSFVAELRATWLGDDGAFRPSVPLAFTSEPLLSGPHALVHDDEARLYFMHGDAATKKVRIASSRFSGRGFGPPADLTLQDPFTGFLAWPCAVESGKDVLLAYDHYQATNHVARGDGSTFGAPVQVGVGVQGRVASFASGALAYTYQNGEMTNMVAYVRVSKDGTTWTTAVPLTTKANVHDVSPFRRADGGVDLYYISSDGAPGFRVYRRSIAEDATLGAEEQVSADAAGSLTQPHPHRLADGSIALTFAVQVTSNVDTDNFVVHLAGDAR